MTGLPDSVRSALRICWVAACALVIAGSLLPPSATLLKVVSALQISDKMEHLGAYAVLAFLPTLHERRSLLAWMILMMFALGILLEFGQLYSPGRSFDVADMFADACGLAVGWLCGTLVRRAVAVLASAEG